jgi:hypothetical protein
METVVCIGPAEKWCLGTRNPDSPMALDAAQTTAELHASLSHENLSKGEYPTSILKAAATTVGQSESFKFV